MSSDALVFGVTRRRRGIIAMKVTLCLGLLAGLPACGAGEPARPRSAVVVLIDTLRADRTSLLGNERETTPHLDALAARGATFEQAQSPSPWTLPSVVGLLSARQPAADLLEAGRLRVSLVEALSAAGFATAAFTESGFVSSRFGMDRGFAHFAEVEVATAGADPGKGGIEGTFAAAHSWLETHGDQRFFLLIHTYEPHMPYTRATYTPGLPPSRLGPRYELRDLRRVRFGRVPFREVEQQWLTALYDGGVNVADAHVGGLVATLEELGLADSTLLVVTSDHGEDLGERSAERAGSHGHALYDELLRVPLVIVDPTLDHRAGQRISSQVRTLDVLPTVLERLGVPVPAGLEGRSLVPLIEGREEADRLAVAAGVQPPAPDISVRDGTHKLIDGPDGLELYDLIADPAEQHDLADDDDDVPPALRRQLAQWRERLDARGGVSLERHLLPPEKVRELEALGYGSLGNAPAPEPEP